MILALFTAATVSTVAVEETAYGHIASTEDVAVEQQVATAGQTEQIVREYFSDIPVMIEVARCESTFRHTLADGTVLRGKVDSRDTGVMQINTYYHADTAEKLGLDLEDLHDNMAYARDLYERKGTQPWSASAPCWSRQLASL
ncbi:MAG: hypothetical protein KC877_04575 [Candidatus Kaiserbacteria bacterium]|nr:hypothetical protein [Candidatus Kaiserbacteria bacterium]